MILRLTGMAVLLFVLRCRLPQGSQGGHRDADRIADRPGRRQG